MAKQKFNSDIDLQGNKIENLIIHPLTTAQRNTLAGTLGVGDIGRAVYDTDQKVLYFWSGIAFIDNSKRSLLYVDQNHIIVESNGTTIQNGAALIAAVVAAKLLTPNGLALSSSNRAVVYVLVGTYNIGATGITLGQFVDIIGIGNPKDIRILCSDPIGAFQIENVNNYFLHNLTINNSAGGSITHNVGQTDDGGWENLIINAANTVGTIFAGAYRKCQFNVSSVINGYVSGVVEDCIGIDSCFGNTTSTGRLINCKRTGTTIGEVHLGTIDGCIFSENSANDALTIGAGARVVRSTVINLGAGEAIAGGAVNVIITHCTFNKAIDVDLVNLISTPYNVVDANFVI